MYEYKSKDYDHVFQKWLARVNCVTKRIIDELSIEDCDPNAPECVLAEAELRSPKHPLLGRLRKLIKGVPQLEWVSVEPGKVWVDVVTGPPTAVRLLYHTAVRRGIPDVDINNIIRSHKAKHRNRGPYFHALKINIYPENISLWDSNFISKEIDLWQDIQNVTVADAVEQARTPALHPRIFRY